MKPAQSHNSSEGHLAIFDALRGACALWVLVGHTAASCGGDSFPVIRHFAVAVDIFMFISGFLMTYHYRLREAREPWDAPSTWLKFYTRRFFRLAPVYYLLLAVTLIFRDQLYIAYLNMVSSLSPAWAHTLSLSPTPAPWSWTSALTHFAFLFGFFPKYCADGHLPDWSIGLEMQFYLVFPFLIYSLRRFGYLSITLACIVFWWLSHQLFGVYVSSPAKLLGLFPQPSFLPLKLDCFVLGILLAEAFWLRRLKTNLALVLLLLGGCVAFLAHSSFYLLAAIVICIFFIFSGGFTASEPRTISIEERMVNSLPVQFLADTSYSVYLVHVPVLILAGSFFASRLWFVALSPWTRFELLLAIMVAVVYPLAFVLCRLIERPGIKLGHRVIATFGRRIEPKTQKRSVNVE